MLQSLWFIVAAGAALLLTAMAVLSLGTVSPALADTGEIKSSPTTPLQKLSWWSLSIGIVLSVAVVGILVQSGIEAFHRNSTVRILVTLIITGGAAIQLLLMLTARSKIASHKLVVDERDLGILGRAAWVQSLSQLATLAVWTVVLTEMHRNSGQIPIVYLSLIFWSSLLVNQLALPMGVLIGYRKE